MDTSQTRPVPSEEALSQAAAPVTVHFSQTNAIAHCMCAWSSPIAHYRSTG